MQLKDCPPVQYIKRRGQRTIRLRVRPDAIVVSAPSRCSDRNMVGFLLEKEGWIRKTLSRLQKTDLEKRDVLSKHRCHMLLFGSWLPLVARTPRPGSKDWKLICRNDRVDVYPPENLSVAALQDMSFISGCNDSAVQSSEGDLFNQQPDAESVHGVGLFYETVTGSRLPLIDVPGVVREQFERELASEKLREEFLALSDELGFSWNRLFIRSQKTKWGTCSAKGNISLNRRLIKCPAHIRRYIMIHELCHTRHLNHSASFWGLVRLHYSEVDAAHGWLKTEGELVFLDSDRR